MPLNNIKKQVLASVVVLHETSTDSLILTKRSSQLRNHPGEVCFPGGLWEETDDNLYATALRELYEELGVTASRVTLIRELQVESTLLGTVIYPWLASIDSINPFYINTEEVSSVLCIPMSLVKNIENYRETIISRGSLQFKSCEFTANEEFIWGATVRIMKQLCVDDGAWNPPD
jgi:hypothetical protein